MPEYSATREDHEAFGSPEIQGDTHGTVYVTKDAWEYTSPLGTSGERVWASQATYNGGGFIANLDINKNISEAIIRELKDNLWIDRQTRAVFVEFTIYNPNVDLFAYVTLVAEFLPGGGATHFATIQIIQAYGMGFFTVVVYICGVCCILYFLVSFGMLVRDIVKQRSACLQRWTTWLEAAILINILVSVVMFSLRTSQLSSVLARMNADKKKYVQFRRVAEFGDGYRYSIAFLNCLALLKLIVLMRLQKRIANLGGILKAAYPALQSFSVCLLIIMLAYASSLYIYFGRIFSDFKSFQETFLTLINASLGGFKVKTLTLVAPGSVVPGLFYCTYMIITSWTLLNVMIAIICETHQEMNDLALYKNAYIDSLIHKVFPGKSEDDKVKE